MKKIKVDAHINFLTFLKEKRFILLKVLSWTQALEIHTPTLSLSNSGGDLLVISIRCNTYLYLKIHFTNEMAVERKD